MDCRLSATWSPNSEPSPLKPLWSSQHFSIERFKGGLNWVPIMPRDASLSDSECKFIQANESDKKTWKKNNVKMKKKTYPRGRDNQSDQKTWQKNFKIKEKT